LAALPLYFDTLVETATKRDDIGDDLVFARMWEHGVAIVEVDAEQVLVNFHNVNQKFGEIDLMTHSYYDTPDDFLALVSLHKFRVANGALEKLI